MIDPRVKMQKEEGRKGADACMEEVNVGSEKGNEDLLVAVRPSVPNNSFFFQKQIPRLIFLLLHSLSVSFVNVKGGK